MWRFGTGGGRAGLVGFWGVRWTDGTAGQRRGMYAGEALSVSGHGLAMGVGARPLSLKLKVAFGS